MVHPGDVITLAIFPLPSSPCHLPLTIFPLPFFPYHFSLTIFPLPFFSFRHMFCMSYMLLCQTCFVYNVYYSSLSSGTFRDHFLFTRLEIKKRPLLLLSSHLLPSRKADLAVSSSASGENLHASPAEGLNTSDHLCLRPGRLHRLKLLNEQNLYLRHIPGQGLVLLLHSCGHGAFMAQSEGDYLCQRDEVDIWRTVRGVAGPGNGGSVP